MHSGRRQRLWHMCFPNRLGLSVLICLSVRQWLWGWLVLICLGFSRLITEGLAPRNLSQVNQDIWLPLHTSKTLQSYTLKRRIHKYTGCHKGMTKREPTSLTWWLCPLVAATAWELTLGLTAPGLGFSKFIRLCVTDGRGFLILQW